MLEGLPKEIVVDDLEPYRTDWWALALMRKRRGEPPPLPLAAVRPRSNEEVSEVMRWATANQVPVVTRGGGSGVCGGTQPTNKTLIVDLTEMKSILDLDATSKVVRAQAGIFGPDLEEALGDQAMTLGHVPQSFHLSTLGGWIATKATGQLSTLYGGIEDRVLGLTAVLADGTIASSPTLPRSSSGPDWWRLFIGSEGTLGVVTEASLSAFGVPEHSHWLEVSFGAGTEGFGSGLEYLRALVQRGIRPAVARLYDEADSSFNFAGLGLEGCVMILRFEGLLEIVDAQVKAALDLLPSDCRVVEKGAGARWWEHRFKAAETYRNLLSGEGVLGPHAVVDTMEVASTWVSLGRLYAKVVQALKGTCDVVLCHASHLYESGANLYFTFLITTAVDERAAEDRYLAAWEAGMGATLENGGTISHHHGIGLLKEKWLEQEQGSGFQVVRRLKSSLDPQGLMNPGKLGL